MCLDCFLVGNNDQFLTQASCVKQDLTALHVASRGGLSRVDLSTIVVLGDLVASVARKDEFHTTIVRRVFGERRAVVNFLKRPKDILEKVCSGYHYLSCKTHPAYTTAIRLNERRFSVMMLILEATVHQNQISHTLMILCNLQNQSVSPSGR